MKTGQWSWKSNESDLEVKWGPASESTLSELSKCVISVARPLFDLCMFDCRFEQAFVNSLVFGRSDDHFWLGLHNEKSSGPFYWLTGEQLTYTNWNRDQPGIHIHRRNTLMQSELFHFHITFMSNKHRSILVQSNESHWCFSFASENFGQNYRASYVVFR